MDSKLQARFDQRLGRHAPCQRETRGKLFKPFAALKGYYDLIELRSAEPYQPRSLSDEDAARINQTLSLLSKGDLVTVTYVTGKTKYQETGAIRQVDEAYKCLRLMNRDIPFSNLIDLQTPSSD